MSAAEREERVTDEPVAPDAADADAAAREETDSSESMPEAPADSETRAPETDRPDADEAPETETVAEAGSDEEAEGESKALRFRKRPSSGRRKRTPRVKNAAEARAILECLLFATTEPLSLRQIRETIHPMETKALQALLVELQNEYDSRGSGVQIVEVAGGYQMATRPRYSEWLVAFQKKKRRSGLSVAMLETLAIIAYKQPIIRAEVDAIRGVDSSGVMHALQDLGLIEAVGQKQVPGRPHLYGTTPSFLKYFGLKSLSDMPSIDALRERFELSQG